ncbi:MAG: 50S ribosomal protein L33 [Chlamydiia bacterium]|nr:50S ribosomal protein L33 [Chlamydiia bacterium]
MAKKSKSGRIKIKLVSKETNIRYYTQKNNKNSKDKIVLMKYASDIGRRVLFKED